MSIAKVEEKKTVLVVDDAPANIQMVNSILKDTYKIRIATNGAKALELVKVVPAPDLILLDVMMPEMDGYEVCTRLKTSSATQDIPVIFLTGQTETEDETRGFEVGAVDYIHKPFSPAVVQARVHTHLTLRGVREQLAKQLLTIRSELETARKIQLSILPRDIPNIQGLEIAARYVPMTSVAGDFYDFIVVDEQHIGVLIADVSGHGMPAALIASMLKIALAAESHHAAEPAAVLAGINKALCGKFQDHFVTAAYAYFDMRAKTLRYAGAGHPPLIVCDGKTGSCRELLENGIILTWVPEAQYTQVEIPLASGDIVVAYTDGIPETQNLAKEEFGQAGLKQFIEAHRNQSADHLSTGLLEEVLRWSERASDDEPDDDITVVAIRVNA